MLEELVSNAFDRVNGLGDADRMHVQCDTGRGAIRRIIAGKVGNEQFVRKLDADLDLFACKNGVFDMRDEEPRFRPIRIDDYVETTTGWAYDAAAAVKHRAAVEQFLRQVFPVDAERRVVLTYVAHLLSGRRSMKKFVVLTDRRAGNNGKSTFAKLLLRFFGSLAMRNTPFVCKATFDKDRSSHDAALGPTKGKRLLIADELKHTMTLDVAMLKDKAGGGTEVSGRQFGSAQQFDYVWQAGFLLIFNEDDCPKIDAADQAFMGRMIVAPMRSKFVDGAVEAEEHTFPLDADIDTKFLDWRSALVDILMAPEHRDLSVLLHVPATMTEWRHDVAGAANPLAEWLDERVTVTGNRADYILLRDLKRTYNGPVGPKEFIGLAKAHLVGRDGVTFKEQASIGGRVGLKMVVCGVSALAGSE